MVRLRLTRMGRKKALFANRRSGLAPRDGRNLEVLGHYNPLVEEDGLKLNLERVDYRCVGAPSDTVENLIAKPAPHLRPDLMTEPFLMSSNRSWVSRMRSRSTKWREKLLC